MLDQEGCRIDLAFGNEVGEDLEDPNDARFDPFEWYSKKPEELETIQMYVEWDLNENEDELLGRKDTSLYAYNTLMFGAAVRIRQGSNLSPALNKFFIEQQKNPQPPTQKKARGRPRKTNDDWFLKRQAIEFAVKHGLKAYRNDVTTERISALDAVEQAATLIYREEHIEEFSSGYGYENLKKIWKKRNKK